NADRLVTCPAPVHLRAITLAGFKTFAQKTEIRFESGITAIVGPNGSGKTNILDAFKWVLGESSAKDLRGKRMDEVIYAGGTRRAIESIITSSPEQRRQLIEEAAQVRGVKAKRSEAADKLRELAANLLRLEDLRGEIEPRLEVVREQAAAAREAAAADQRLEILRGSIVYEEWREARDAHRR